MRNRLLATAVVAVLAVTFAVVQARTQQQPQPLDIQKVKEGLYVILGSGGNVGVRVTNEGVIVSDDKFEQNFQEIMNKIKSVTDKPVKYVLSTHHHGDHTGGNVGFINMAEIIAHKNVRINMLKANPPQKAPPRVTFTDQTAVYLGGAEAQMHHVGRGHTNGDSVIYYPDLRTVHTGDLYVTNGVPFIDYDNGGDASEWITTLDNILKLDFDTAIPGHGNVMMKKEDLRKFRMTFDTMQKRTTDLIKKGVAKDQLLAQLKMDDMGWTVAPNSNFAQRSLNGFYAEMGGK